MGDVTLFQFRTFSDGREDTGLLFQDEEKMDARLFPNLCEKLEKVYPPSLVTRCGRGGVSLFFPSRDRRDIAADLFRSLFFLRRADERDELAASFFSLFCPQRRTREIAYFKVSSPVHQKKGQTPAFSFFPK